MGSIGKASKFSKKNRLLLIILICSIAVVFSFLAVLLYINYYARVNIILTTITWYEDGGVKNVTEYDIVTIKKGRTVNSLPKPSVEGYKFGGWYFNKECTDEFDYSKELHETIQIYGKLNLLEYSIELVLDDSTKVASNISRDYNYEEKLTIEDVIKLPRANDAVTLQDGTETSIDEYKALNREGYTFEGWGFSATAYKTIAFDYRMSAQNLTFYAIWKPIQVELQYWSPSLDFAETNPQSGDVQRRINRLNGGLDYSGRHGIYVSETLEYATKVNIVAEPSDQYNNFEFMGWYLDPEFTVPLKFAQLYVRNGYFSLTKENNKNILQDELYFDDGHILDDVQLEVINQYSSRDESNSFIKIFAKWELKKYTVRFHLNLPDAESYVKTAQMRSIVYDDVPMEVFFDNADNLMAKDTVFQGQDLAGNSGVLYHDDYFKNVVYIKNDLTGLPLYTFKSWNSQKDGMGYDLTHSGHSYFDKSHFNIDGDEIVVYAQWTSYYRVNYYLTGATDQFGVASSNNILLGTVNVSTSVITMPELNSLVADLTDRRLTFTPDQQYMNEQNVNMSTVYYTPLNRTFIGWSNDTTYSQSSPIYIENVTYNVGTDVSRNNGIALNSPVRNLYTTWINNINAYRYDLGEDGLEKADFSKNAMSQNMQNAIITNVGGNKSYLEYVYETTNTYATVQTIYNEEFLVTKIENSELYSLNGWRLADGTKIDGKLSQEIKFNRSPLYIKYINNSVCDLTKYRDVETGVYFEGNRVVSRDDYYTRYDSNEDRSYIVLKVRNYTILVFDGVWVKNITLTYNPGVGDAVWASGTSADTLTNIAGGSVYMQFSDPANIMSRPYYKFYGWSTTNREDTEVIRFDEYVKDTTIYYPNTRYYDIFETDTELYAVWQPVVYTVNTYTQEYNSLVNSSCGKFLIAKEKFIYNGNSVTDCIVLNNNSVTTENVSGDTVITALTTSALAGYGLSAWTNSEGVHLQKADNKYTISVADDVNALFEQHPETDYNNVSIYPTYSIIKYTVTILLYGEDMDSDGIKESEVEADIPDMEKICTEIQYGTNLKTLLPQIYTAYFDQGYQFKGWNIKGDVDYGGQEKEEYILSAKNLSSSNILVKSDLTITLVADRLKYTVKFVFNNPNGDASKIVNYELYHGDSLGTLKDEIEAELALRDYVGYNFKHWQATAGGMTSYLTQENMASALVTSPMDLNSKYERADVKVIFNYNNDSNTCVEVIESEFLSNVSLSTTYFAQQPKKDGYLLKGWAVGEDEDDAYFAVDSVLSLTVSQVGSYLVRPAGANYFNLNLYAKWVEKVTLTFDIDDVIISYPNFPTEIVYEKGSKIFFVDMPYISSLSNTTIRQTSGLGDYSEIWTDGDNDYRVKLSNSFITMDRDITISPKFNPKTFYITYHYSYGGRYYTVDALTSRTDEQYVNAPVLATKAQIDAEIVKHDELINYRSVELYLSKDKYELKDVAYKFDLGAEFDFISNASYVNAAANGNTFEFYIELRELQTLTYYFDRDESAVEAQLVFDGESSHVIGDTNNDGTVDFVPTKMGYEFIGWSSSLVLQYVQHNNGDVMAPGSLNNLYPVWRSQEVNVIYCDSDGNDLAYDYGRYFTDSITVADIAQTGKKLVGWKTVPDGIVEYEPGTTLTLETLREDFAVQNGSLFEIYLYAEWEVARFSITFETYDENGAITTLYGTKLSTLITSEFIAEYDDVTVVNYSFPDTAETYTIGGQKYKFANKWKCGGNYYSTTNTSDLKFTKDFEYVPVYEKIHTLTFKYGTDVVIYEVDVKDGSTYYFNDADLINATSDYNTNSLLPFGSKIVAYTYNSSTYDSSKFIAVGSSMTFTAKVVELVRIVIYRDLAYDGTNFSFANEVSTSNVELSASINLNDSGYQTSLENCTTVGFVVSTNSDYGYNPDATRSTGSYFLSASGASKGETIYFYPVIKTSAVYYVNGVRSDDEEVLFGKQLTKTEITEEENQYYTNWRIGSQTGAEYDGSVVHQYLELYTVGKPFLQLKVSSLDNFIDNSSDLTIRRLRPSDVFSLPLANAVTLKEPTKHSIIGWYISYEGEYVMDGSNMKEYSLGQSITLGGVISDLGKNVDEINQVSFDMHPIINYNLKTLTLSESANITYSFVVNLQCDTTGLSSTEIEELKNRFVVNNSGYGFKVLNASTLTVNTASDTIRFTAYLVNGGKVVNTNGQPTTAIIIVSKVVDPGYTSSGWIYTGTNTTVISSDRVYNDTGIQAQTVEADELTLAVNLKFYNGTNTVDIDENNIDDYDDFFYINTSNKYGYSINTTFGSIINFAVVTQNGYEIYAFTDGSGNPLTQNIAVSGNTNTFTHQVGSATQLYVVVRKSLEFKPIITINSTGITGYDASKIANTSSMYVEYRENVAGSSWTKLYKDGGNYTLNWSEFGNGYQYANTIGVNNFIRLYTSIDSRYYYVSQINVYNDGSLNNAHGGANSISSNNVSTEIEVTGVVEIELVLAERTYLISYYDGDGSIVSGSSNAVTDTIEVNLPSVSKEGHTLQGFRVFAGSVGGYAQFIEYITVDDSYSISDLQEYTTDRNNDNQETLIILNPVLLKNQKSITITSADGYFTINGVVAAGVDLTIPYGSSLTFSKTESDGIITINSLGYVNESSSVVADGVIETITTNVTIVFVPYGNLNFVEGYIDVSTNNIFTTMQITEDIVLLPKVEEGNGTITFTINDDGEYNNKNLTLGAVKFSQNGADLEEVVAYDENASLSTNSYSFDSKDNCIIELDLESAFSVSSIDIVIGGYKLSDYDSLSDFENALHGLAIEIDGNKVTFTSLIYDVEVVYNVERNSYSTFVQIENDGSLTDIFAEITGNGDSIASVGSVEAIPGANTLLGLEDLRTETEYNVSYNLNYFDIERIYYVDNGTTYTIFGSGATVDSLSSFNPITNQVNIVYGGDLGNDITLYIKLKLRTFNVVIHTGDSSIYSTSGDYSEYVTGLTPSDDELKQAYAYNAIFTINGGDLFVPNNETFAGANYEFGHWAYYDGNYENDLPLDSNKMKELTSLSWTFSAEKGDLHIFAYCTKLFNINFEPINDGIDAEQTNFPANSTDVSKNDEVILTIAERSGFTFGGYSYMYNGNKYSLRYNGTSFVALQNELGQSVTTLEAFDENEIKLSMIITSDMIAIAPSFNTISFEPIWERNSLTLTINNDSSKGVVETYTYDSGSFVAGTFEVQYYNTLQVGTINLSGVDYNCLYVKEGANYIGAIVAKPKTANYYKFGSFQIEGTTITTHTLDESSEVDVIYAVDYVPHVLNLAWDKPYSEISYTVENTGANHIKIEAYNNSTLEQVATILDAGDTITYNATYDKVVIYALRGSEIYGTINLNGYHNDATDESEILVELPALLNTMPTSSSYTLKANLVDVNLSQYMSDDLDTTSTDGGAYKVGYYAPIVDGNSGLIVDYEIALTYVTISSGEEQLTDIVSGSYLYFEKQQDSFDIVAILNGNNNITNVDNTLNSIYVTMPNGGTYDIKVVFDYEYSLVNFKINNNIYASAYFKTTTGNSANEQLVAFANVVVNGYSNSGAYVNSLFDGVNGLVYKTNGYNKEAYTEAELIALFNYDINKNIAMNYYTETAWQNVWFEEFNFGNAYLPITGVTIDDLYIETGVKEVNFVATISDALVLNMEANIISADNGATPNGSFVLDGDDYASSYAVLGSSQVGYNGHYSVLNIKVKDGENLPKLGIDKDVNTYTSNDTIEFSEKKFSSTDNTGLLAVGGRYDYVHNFEVKHIKLLLSTTDNNGLTNWMFEQDFSNSENPNYKIMEFNYSMTFNDIITEYGLPSSYTEDVEYFYSGIYYSGNRIDEKTVEEFLEGLSYYNNQQVYLVVQYLAQA